MAADVGGAVVACSGRCSGRERDAIWFANQLRFLRDRKLSERSIGDTHRLVANFEPSRNNLDKNFIGRFDKLKPHD